MTVSLGRRDATQRNAPMGPHPKSNNRIVQNQININQIPRYPKQFPGLLQLNASSGASVQELTWSLRARTG